MTQNYFEFTPEQNELLNDCRMAIRIYVKKHGRVPTHVVAPVKRLIETELVFPFGANQLEGVKIVPCGDCNFINCFYDGYI